jgi:beta-galactosidase
MTTPTLGVCYYPEHWPEDGWAEDAARMAELGLTWVRIGEFAWSRLEPRPGDLRLDWLHRATDALHKAGLKVVLGTPTATPPRWLVDKHPDMLAIDADGKPRGFGSRRHYSFSYSGYREECARIVGIIARAFGDKVDAWQTDNEYGCHDTVRSYGPHDRIAFQNWLQEKYKTIDTLNARWGNVFWSMEYNDFAQIDLPNLTVTEANPAHVLDYKRFASDEVVSFNRLQTDIIRKHSNAPISHNYMGRVLEFDHFALGDDLEIATWDSYPLGFLEDRIPASEVHKTAHARQGDPDFQAFHHDLYRAVGGRRNEERSGPSRWWVMEQQPGPVNWAPVNPAPLPGMVRAWTWEAVSHGAEVVAYFRWRQLPFAQEQMHAGLLNADGSPSGVWEEVKQTALEVANVSRETSKNQSVSRETEDSGTAPVGIIFDYTSCWAWDTQPQGEGFSHFDAVMTFYRALRRLGVSVDILPPDTTDFSTRKAVIIPALFTWTPELKKAMERYSGQILVGPRTAQQDADFQLQTSPLPGISIKAVETFRDRRAVKGGGAFTLWAEQVETTDNIKIKREDGWPALIKNGNTHYLCGWPDAALCNRLISSLLDAAHVETEALPGSLRCRDWRDRRVYINYGAEAVSHLGDEIPPAGVKIVPNLIEKR